MGSIPEVVQSAPEGDWKENVKLAFMVYDQNRDAVIDQK